MANTDIKYRDFEGITFNGRHSSEFHLVRVSDGDRYQISLIPSSQHQTVDMPGKDGSYYYGKKNEPKNFPLKFAFDELTELDIRKIRQWLSIDEPVSLIFDEWPYKVYYAMPESEPVMETICFNRQDGSRVYKGEVEINMIAYYPYARSQSKRLIDYDAANVADSREFKRWDNIVEGWYENFDKYITRIDTEVFTRTEGLPYPQVEKIETYAYSFKYKPLRSDLPTPPHEQIYLLGFSNMLGVEDGTCQAYVLNGQVFETIGEGRYFYDAEVQQWLFNLLNENETFYQYEYMSDSSLISVSLLSEKQEGYLKLPTNKGQYLENKENFEIWQEENISSEYSYFLAASSGDSFPSSSYKLNIHLNKINQINFLGIDFVFPEKLYKIIDPGSLPLVKDGSFLWIELYGEKDNEEQSFTCYIDSLAGIILFIDQNKNKTSLFLNQKVYDLRTERLDVKVANFSANSNTIEIADFPFDKITKVITRLYFPLLGKEIITWNSDTKEYVLKEFLEEEHIEYDKIFNNAISFTDKALSRLEAPPSLISSITDIVGGKLFNKHPDYGNEFSIKREDKKFQNYYDFKSYPPRYVLNSLYFPYINMEEDENKQINQTNNGPTHFYIQFPIDGKEKSFLHQALLSHQKDSSGSLQDLLVIPSLGKTLTRLPKNGYHGDQEGFTVNSTGKLLRLVFSFDPNKETYKEAGEKILWILDNSKSFFYYYPLGPINFEIEQYTLDPGGPSYWPINDFIPNWGSKFPLWRKNYILDSEAPFSKIYIDARSKRNYLSRQENGEYTTIGGAHEWAEASGIINNPEEFSPAYDKYQNGKIPLYNPGDIPAPYKIKYNLNLAGKNSEHMLDLISLNNDYSLYWSLGGLDQTSIKLTADTRAALLSRVNFIDFNSLSPNYYFVNEYNRIQNLKYDGRWYSQIPLQKITFEKDTDLTLVLSLSNDLAGEANLWTHAKINFYRISDNINYNFPAKSFQITPKKAVSTNNRQFSISHTVPKGNYLISIQCFFKKSEGTPAGWGTNPENNYTWKEQEIGKYYQLYLFENNKEPNENYITGQICFDSDKQSIYWTSDTRREVLLEDMLEEGKYLPIPVTNFFLDEQLDKTIDINFHFWKKNGTARTEIDDIGEIGLNTNSPIEIEYDYLYY